jgi:predicted RNA-binding Zn ribbon-like protein
VTAWSDGHFIAGELALDFANTVYRRTPELGPDLLDSTDALARWFEHAGLLPANATRDETVLEEARELRRVLWEIFEAQRDGHSLPVDALAALLDLAGRGLGPGLAVTADGAPVPLTVGGAVAAIALRGVALALRPPSRPVRTCDRCGWFFLDTSRAGRRRWCSMKTCGNQAKVSRHRSAVSAMT